jgi:hypothetical protein
MGLIMPTQLVHYVVHLASERNAKLTTLRLVKFLYLADLYHARAHNGKTLTGWTWKFVYFGPYCSEASRTIDDAVRAGIIKTEQRGSSYANRDDNLFWCEEEEDLQGGYSTLKQDLL